MYFFSDFSRIILNRAKIMLICSFVCEFYCLKVIANSFLCLFFGISDSISSEMSEYVKKTFNRIAEEILFITKFQTGLDIDNVNIKYDFNISL